MASTTPLVGLDDWDKDGRQVKGFYAPPLKKEGTNTPWTLAEEDRLKSMKDAGNSWEEIAKNFPSRTEASVKKHWYMDLHYAEFAEDDSASLLAAINEYEASKRKIIEHKVGKPVTGPVLLAATNEYEGRKWKVIGHKVGKPAKACEKYARENFARGNASDNQSPYTKKQSSMSSRHSDEHSTKEKRVRGGDETPADASDNPKRQKTSDFDYPEHPRTIVTSTTAASFSPHFQDHHSSHVEVPTVSGKYRPVFPPTSSSTGLESLPFAPVAAKDIAAKSEGEVEPTLRENEDILSDGEDMLSDDEDMLSDDDYLPDEDTLSDDEDILWHNSMGLIENKVRGITARQQMIRATLVIEWDLLDFMKTQYPSDGNAKLGSVVTLTGTVLRAQATTCSDYAQKTWPAQGLFVIKAFESAIKSGDHKAKVGRASTSLDIELGQMCTLHIISGHIKIIVDVFQQAIWMGAALRVSSYHRVQYAIFNLEQKHPQTFVVKYDEFALPKKSCWLSIFKNPLIARGFPVPNRENGEQGLEIPIEIMAALGGARHATQFQGGLVLKGHSAMFVPLKRYDQSIQWHLIRRSGEHRILYREVSDECPNRAMLEEVDHDALLDTRAFLGWWPCSETHLGTADAAYNNIDWSPAGDAKRTTKFSGANIGFQTMITGQLHFILGAKDGRSHFPQKGPFQRIIQCAENTPVVLYDTEDHRAWLVPALDVMLHIVQTRHHISPYKIHGQDITLTPVTTQTGKRAATRAVMANKWRQLYDQDNTAETNYYYMDAILDLWSQIERLKEKEDSLESDTGLALHGTMRSQIYGWEYMSLVHDKNYRRKEAAIAKTSGGWADLINDTDAFILFATGLGDVIKPVADLNKLCPLWRSLPKGKDYLAACVPIMMLLYSEAGSRLSHKHLSTSHLQWHRGSTLFEQCSGTFSGRCECDRTQQIYHDSLFRTFGHVRPPGKLEEDGCVVFGLSRHPFKPTKAIAMRQNAVHILPNTSIQTGRTTQQTHEKDDGVGSPVPPASISPEPEEFDNHVTRNSKRPVSPLSSRDGLVQESAVASKRRRETSKTQVSNFDASKGPKDKDHELSQSDHCVTSTLGFHWKDGHIEYCNQQHSKDTETVYASEAEIAPVDVGRTLRHKSRIGRL